ncbi:hypothetical protein Tsubulata_007593 [Turnera subulata]|uniref:BURP domain-containing protein n=1 Tax=Turnera subulata TaxID=218843 RepID=A0A9Q0FGS9_9ROSI|nr:hypothetical protein Tsubulata_007593 [Turnera subulata]
MERTFISWSLILPLIMLLTCAPGNEARALSEEHLEEMMMNNNNVLRLPTMNDGSKDDVGDAHHHQMDPTFKLYFTMNDLREGNQFSIHFPEVDPTTTSSSHILPKGVESIPFSHKQLPSLLKIFSIPEGSPSAKSMEATLRFCETKLNLKDSSTFCATSAESMHDFLRTTLGFESQPHLLATSHLSEESKSRHQMYTIQGAPKEIIAPKTVACHPLPYPYSVLFCHVVESRESKFFKVSLAGENGDRVEAISLCHDTAKTRWAWLRDQQDTFWATDNESLSKFEAEMGFPNIVCHFFSAQHHLWVPAQYP